MVEQNYIEVTAAVIKKGDTVLITQRSFDDVDLPGLWEFPGGKIEVGETAESCLKRELKEELGIDVTVGRELDVIEYQYPDKLVRLLFYEVEYTGGEIILNAHADAVWVHVKKLLEYEFAPADITFVKKLVRSGRAG